MDSATRLFHFCGPWNSRELGVGMRRPQAKAFSGHPVVPRRAPREWRRSLRRWGVKLGSMPFCTIGGMRCQMHRDLRQAILLL
jgi:hypothetical protein